MTTNQPEAPMTHLQYLQPLQPTRALSDSVHGALARRHPRA